MLITACYKSLPFLYDRLYKITYIFTYIVDREKVSNFKVSCIRMKLKYQLDRKLRGLRFRELTVN